MKNFIKKLLSLEILSNRIVIRFLGFKLTLRRYFKLNKEYKKFVQSLSQPPKFKQIRLELSNACGYKCFMCPHTKMTRPVGFMQDKDIETIAKNISYRDEIEMVHLHGFGEPLLIKDLFHKAEVVRSYFPNAVIQILSTLGYEVEDDFFEKLLNSEINQLIVSFYGYNRENYQKMHGVDKYDIAYKNLKKLVEINKKYNNKLDLIINLFDNDFIQNTDVALPDNSKLLKEFRNEVIGLGHNKDKFYYMSLHNFGSGKNFTDVDRENPCSIAYGDFKRFLQISWNLNVIPCCMVYDDEMVFGNLNESTVDEIFSSDYYKTFLKNHLDNNIGGYISCRHCTKYYDASVNESEFIKIYLKDKKKKRINAKSISNNANI